MVGSSDERRSKKLLMPILILILCFSGISSVSYTLMISDVTNEFTIFSEDDVQLKLVDGDGIVINGMGGFSRKANDGKGASKIFYTGSCTDGNPEQLLYYVIAQSLELGKTNLDISVKDKTVKYVRVSFELKWASDFNPVEEYGLDLKLCISGTGTTATSIGLTVDISHKLQGNNTYVNGLPYFQTSEFILKNSSGTVVDMSDIPISPGINTFHVEFYGIMNSSQSVGSVSPSFEYQLLFKATPL